MMQQDDTRGSLELLRELPPEISIDQVGQMVALFPLATGATAGLLSLIKHNLNTTLMTTTAGTLIVGGSMYLFSAADPAPEKAIVESPAPIAIEMAATPAITEEPAVVLHLEAPKINEKPQHPTAPAPQQGGARSAMVPTESSSPAPNPTALPEPVPANAAPPPAEPHVTTPLRVLRKKEGEREYDLSGFTGVSLQASIDVIIEQGAFSVLAMGETDALDRLRMELKNGVLTVDQSSKRYEPGNCNTALLLKVRMPSIAKLEVLGSGNMKASRFNGGGPIDLLLRGSGDLILEDVRSASTLNIEINGSGDLAVTGMREAGSMRLRLDGSGDAACTGIAVAGTTVIDLSGSGDVALSGSTDRIEVNLIGSGDVMARDMRSRTAKARVVGSGDVHIHSGGTVEREVIGSGEVHVLGSAGGNGPRGVGDRSQ